MTAPAALSGTFADFKLVKTRSAAQIIIEVPIEQADHALAVLGGIPQFGKERHVALARLQTAAEAPKERTPFDELKRAQQAGIACNDVVFRTFLKEAKGVTFHDEPEPHQQAATAVRKLCNVNSRAQFDSNPEARAKWETLHSEFQAWKTV